MGLRRDIWRAAIVDAPIAEILNAGSVEPFPIHYLPATKPFAFLADPFGLWRDGRLHVFVEAFDYRVRVGAIDCLTYSDRFDLLDRRPVLREPWHLSYPLVFEGEGETWMLPEANESGRLTLYRAIDFPARWEAAHVIPLDHVPVDATPVFHDGLWWLFSAPVATWELHIAFAERLAGPWHRHSANPARIGADGTRPGGRAQVIAGRIMLPVQDCRHTYGGAVRLLHFDELTPDKAMIGEGRRIGPSAAFAPYTTGLHTLSAAGPVTLIDMKYTELSLRGVAIETLYRSRRLVRAISGR